MNIFSLRPRFFSGSMDYVSNKVFLLWQYFYLAMSVNPAMWLILIHSYLQVAVNIITTNGHTLVPQGRAFWIQKKMSIPDDAN